MPLIYNELSSDSIVSLQEWYKSQCNSDWEHHYGISIESLDNPGWLIKIDLTGTNMEEKTFSPLKEGENRKEKWIDVQKVGNVFQGAGDADKLGIIIGIFMNWVSTQRV